MKTGAPGRAPGRPALPSSQTGRRLAVRPACSPGDEPACDRPVRAGGPCRSGAWVADDRCAGGAGGRRWGRSAARAAPAAAGEPPPTQVRGRALPRPASRTPVPFPRHRAPARGASACSIGGSSARGTCVRKGRGGVGRNGARSRSRARPMWLWSAEEAASSCNTSCNRSRGGAKPVPTAGTVGDPGAAAGLRWAGFGVYTPSTARIVEGRVKVAFRPYGAPSGPRAHSRGGASAIQALPSMLAMHRLPRRPPRRCIAARHRPDVFTPARAGDG
jgi:hypothetical protein